VDSTSAYGFLIFMEAYLAFRKISIWEHDQVHTTFIIHQGQYYRKTMLFA